MFSKQLKVFIFILLYSIYFVNEISSQNLKIDSLRKILASRANDTIIMSNCRNIINEFIDISEHDSAIKYGNLGLKLALPLKDSFYIQKFYGRLEVSYWSIGMFEEALKSYSVGVNYCRNENELGPYYNNTGLVYWDKGELPKALELFLKSYDIDKKFNNQEGMASSLLNLGLVYDDLKDQKNAMRYYYLSLELARKINDLVTVGKIYNNLGKIFADQKNRFKALDFYYRSLAVSSKAADKANLGMVTNNIGGMYLDQNILDSALKYLNWSYKTFSEIGDVGGMALVVNNLGQLYISKKNFKKAEQILTQALVVNKQAYNYEELATSYRNLAAVYFYMNKPLKAYECFLEYDKLRDTVISIHNTVLLSDIRKEYDIKEAEKVVNMKRESDKLVAAAEKRKQFFITLSVIFVLILVVVFSFFLYRRFRITQKQKVIIEEQKHVVEEKQKEILDSIHYAKRIQSTIISNQIFIDENIPNNFVYFNPKDIVSGDFYWATRKGFLFYLAICDSTGHGVPGAFMSLLNIGFLSEAINEKGIEKPNEIFNYVRERLVNSISKEGQKDGFDGILICYNLNTNKFTYAAANNEPVLIRKGEIIELSKDKMPVGIGEKNDSFRLFEPDIQSGDSFYFYTDGYADQFGGPKGKKFKYKQLNELLLSNSMKSVLEQKEIIQSTFNSWKGDLEQVDDVCIIGIRL